MDIKKLVVEVFQTNMEIRDLSRKKAEIEDTLILEVMKSMPDALSINYNKICRRLDIPNYREYLSNH